MLGGVEVLRGLICGDEGKLRDLGIGRLLLLLWLLCLLRQWEREK